MDWLNDHLWQAWLGLGILLGLAELLSLDLILIMLAVGSGVGMLTALLGLPLPVQVLAAAVASVAMLGTVRPTAVRRLRQGPTLEQGHSKLVGQRGIVTETISTHQVGRIKLAGEIWSAQAYDESVAIGPGETVEVLQIKGATAVVLPIPSLDS
jgi:membrane protein implicated in regulation of membrane protease activity